jgi:hypothetical protein
LILEDAQRSHDTVACVDPVVGDEAGYGIEEGKETLADETTGFCIISDSLVAPHCCPHANSFSAVVVVIAPTASIRRRVAIVIAGRQGCQTPERDRSLVSAPDLPIWRSP